MGVLIVIMICDYKHNYIGYTLDTGQMNAIVASINWKKTAFILCVCVHFIAHIRD